MSAVPSESPNKLLKTLSFCRTSIAATWKLGLANALLVAILSLTAGALPSTSVIRGGVCFLVFGLIGWGINAVLVTAGEQVEMRGEENRSPAVSDEDAES